FTFQPSEMVKLFFIFYLASEFSEKLTVKGLILPSVMSCIVILCLVFQKDLGSALIFFMIFMSMLYISTGNAFLISGGFLLFSVACVISYKLFSHVRVRVESWLDPWSDIDAGGYQITQSLFAIGTGGFFGSGLTRGMEDSIPVIERDFIFSAICEEFGVLFAVGLIILVLLMFSRSIRICLQCKNKFLCLLGSSIAVIICFQSFLIIGGVIKLIPLTGVTLPFVSYGGSSMLVSFLMIAILQWTASLRPVKKPRKQKNNNRKENRY
ncbi:MAG: FtsW/RodA/SpoVE family cell cycle protein, partial [Firmicutes bacterium]|nr:FtsW/RodA/SpoVE family cell cycle protein [Bacillota bacterium]